MRDYPKIFLGSLLILFLSACATYYQKSVSFQNDFALGNLEKAKTFLEKNSKAAEKKDRLLYFFDRGVIDHMLGNYAESNEYFEEAYTFHQSYRKSLGSSMGSYLTNDMTKPYEGEDFEVVLVHFYKTLNYIYLNDLDAALIEVRRINIQLNEFNSKYEGKKNRYTVDAFSLLLAGLIYEAQGEYNDAFIAYRNAYNAYQDVYQEHFKLSAPPQLKVDILRMAKKIGFMTELDFYEREFGMQYDESWESGSGELVFFWLNGLGPVKGEFSLTLTKVAGSGGVLTFANENEDMSFPVPINNYSSEQASTVSDIGFVRLALPRYRSRIPYYSSASIQVEGITYPLMEVEDINGIARSTLEDREQRELAQSIGRLVLKQATEAVARSKNEDVGAAVSIINALTEKADTRNWQTLPHSIYYQRIPLSKGKNEVQLLTKGPRNVVDTLDFTFEGGRRLTFTSYHSLQSSPPQKIMK